ncbi:Oxidoreductase family, NAD-binding Rossmann fold [Popillia japonica]|uniref:Oxidoreductase family, NAD-binding Rossmann fold n=1 Tax=Popillia japonica TaxID=7064 RepID=A0AAW1HFH8_POPJA
MAAKLDVQEVYQDYREMFQKADCDAVAIVTPDYAHAEVAEAAANAGKNMLIEKPLATTRDDVYRIVNAVEKNQVRAMVDLHNRWSPPFNAAYESVAGGELGKIYSAYMRLNDVKWVATDMLPWAANSS